MSEKLRVGILGATGMVGQRLCDRASFCSVYGDDASQPFF